MVPNQECGGSCPGGPALCVAMGLRHCHNISRGPVLCVAMGLRHCHNIARGRATARVSGFGGPPAKGSDCPC